MRGKKTQLHDKLLELKLMKRPTLEEQFTHNSNKLLVSNGIKRRRHSADSINKDDGLEEPCVHTQQNLVHAELINNTRSNYTLRSFGEQPEKYIQFLIYLCKTYRELIAVTSSGIETICQEILTLCQPSNEVNGYDIHKSLFYEHIFKDPTISVLNAM